VTVTLKLVQVYVADAKGNPALDLERSDFVLYDNGKLQTITDFEKHFLRAPEAKLGEAVLPPGRDLQSVMDRKFVFFIDYGKNDLPGIMKSKNAALEFLDTKIQPGDEVALFSFSTISGLTLHEYFTSDHGKVRAAIKKIRETPGILPGLEVSSVPGHEPTGMELMNLQIMGPHGGHAGAAADPRVFFSSVKEWAKALGHIPGQKNIVFFSQGFGEDAVKPNSHSFLLFQAMARELATANAPVFSVNTTTGVEAKIAAGVLPEGSLKYLSNLTGGQYFADVTSYSRIAEGIQKVTSNYYVLGYPIAASWDGRFHEIKVEVHRPRYKVSGQRGYANPLPFNKLSAIEKHLQLLDLALGEKAYAGQHLAFPLIALPFSGRQAANTILLAGIPVERVRQDIGDNTEFISLILDQDKTIVDGRRFEINWRTISGREACQYSAVSLRPGRYDCRVVIRNLDNGKGAVGACSVDIPEKTDAYPKLDPPLLLAAGGEIPYLNVSGQGKEPSGAAVSLFQVFPFPAKEFVPLTGEVKEGTSSIYGVLRSAWGEPREPEIEISAWLVQEGKGEKIPLAVDILSVTRQEDTEIRFLELGLPELRPGQYFLHILAEDPGSKSSAETTADLQIRLK
jgi:VWFA-related protein